MRASNRELKNISSHFPNSIYCKKNSSSSFSRISDSISNYYQNLRDSFPNNRLNSDIHFIFAYYDLRYQLEISKNYFELYFLLRRCNKFESNKNRKTSQQSTIMLKLSPLSNLAYFKGFQIPNYFHYIQNERIHVY